MAHGGIEVVYIGRAGKKGTDGNISLRKAGLGGMKDQIVNGHQFGKVARKNSWPAQMLIEDIEAFDVYWYVTHDQKLNDCPDAVERTILEKHIEMFGRLPRWNKI